MEGVPTAAGMTLYADFRPDEDATVVTRLHAAGAIILGKLQLTESAYADHHPAITPPKNPWSAEHWPGASSSGSGVATAAGLCYGSLGSDTGGSIRFPSAAQGLTGLKPSWGRVSRHGVFELAATLDHVGPMTRLRARCGGHAGGDRRGRPEGPDGAAGPRARLSGDDRGWRRGVCGSAPPRPGSPVRPMPKRRRPSRRRWTCLRGLGAEIVEVTFPDIRQAVQDWFPLCGVETAVAHARTFPAQREAYGPALAGIIELGRSLSGLDYQRIILRREDLRGRVNALMTEIDLLLIPAMGFAAPSLAKMGTLGTDDALMNSLLGFTCPFDMTGHPSLTLPGGFTPVGLPVAFQIIGAHGAEGLLSARRVMPSSRRRTGTSGTRFWADRAMCDTIVAQPEATADGVMLLAKNADTEVNEAQQILRLPARAYGAGTALRVTHLTIPQARQTHEVILDRSFWAWGGEIGCNEHGVAIGNEAAFSNQTAERDGVIILDLLRLGLERGATAPRGRSRSSAPMSRPMAKAATSR